MKTRNWYLLLGLLMLLSAVFFYFIHYAIFRDPHHIFIYMVGDLAFLFVEVLLVALIIHKLLENRDRRMQMEKLNMVIGTFFSEVGTELIERFCVFDPDCPSKRELLAVTGTWDDEDFAMVSKEISHLDFKAEGSKGDLEGIKSLLVDKRDFLVRLLENPLLLEHESFTDMLWAVFHLAEELSVRESLSGLPEADLDHLSGDISRAYGRLVREWLGYMAHLKGNYPYLFSLAMRMNPFDADATPVFT